MVIGCFGSYDETLLSNRVILNGLEDFARDHEIRFIHASVPARPLYRPGHLNPLGLFARLWARGIASIRLLSQREQVRECDVLIVLPFALTDLLLAGLFRLLYGVQIIYVPQASLYDLLCYASGSGWFHQSLKRFVYQFERLVYRIPQVVVFNSAAEVTYHRELLNLPRLRTMVIPLGADDRLFVPAKPTRHAGLNILFYGEYNVSHGADLIVEAAQRLSSYADIRFTMIGEGRTSGSVCDQIDALKLKNIRRLGWLDTESLLAHIQESDIVLGMFRATPAMDKVVPNKVYQGLACGKCVITSESKATRAFFHHGQDIYLVEPSNSEALAAAILALYQSPAQRKKIAACGLATFQSHFDREAIAHQYIELAAQLHFRIRPHLAGSPA